LRRFIAPILVAVLLTLSTRTASAEAERPEEVPSAWWVAPIDRLSLTLRAVHEAERTYSVATRPRDIAGSLALSCQNREGEPCGDGAGGFSNLDSGAGYGTVISLFARLRLVAGGAGYGPDITLDRIRLRGSKGPITADIGRDVLGFGPSHRVQLGWGTNALPVDRVHVFTAHPIELGSQLGVVADYALARLRAPQTYPGNLVSIVHGQLNIGSTMELGVIQLLQIGGDGAPHLGAWDFIAEHVRRGDNSASPTDSSNRRFGGDVAVRVPSLRNARFYYQLIFEDIRKARFIDAVRYDADHLVGVDVEDDDRRLTIEWHQTGIRSQEHTPRVTGFTNGGFAVGSPLGPDAKSFFVGGRLSIGPAAVLPWAELVSLASDKYELIVDGPINRVESGRHERRYRLGSGCRVPLDDTLSLEGDVFYEHVTRFEFQPDSSRNNVGITASIVWNPDGPLGRLTLN
jgi:hypothetical protein